MWRRCHLVVQITWLLKISGFFFFPLVAQILNIFRYKWSGLVLSSALKLSKLYYCFINGIIYIVLEFLSDFYLVLEVKWWLFIKCTKKKRMNFMWVGVVIVFDLNYTYCYYSFKSERISVSANGTLNMLFC